MLLNKQYTKYGITLIPLTSVDLELVYKWRTSGKLDHFIGTNGYISKEKQLEWFENINNENNQYFIVLIDHIKVGLIQINNIKNESKTGFYIYEDRYQDSIYSYKIVTLFHEILFFELELREICCHILPSNKRAIRFNKSIGFEYRNNDIYYLSKDQFVEKLKKYQVIIEHY